MSTYFTKRDAENLRKLELILEKDLPDFCMEYFVGISSNTTTLTRLNYAYDIRTFFEYLCAKTTSSRVEQPRKLHLRI